MNRFAIAAVCTIAFITAVVALTAPVMAQEIKVAQLEAVPDWFSGKLIGEQTVKDRPDLGTVPVDIAIHADGWTVNLTGPMVWGTVKGTVAAVAPDGAVVLRGMYTRGRNYGKKVKYDLRRREDGVIVGSVTADWITWPIEVTFRSATPPTSRSSAGIVAVLDGAMHRECLDAFGIPDREGGCSKIPQP